MLNSIAGINWLAVLVATFTSFALAGTWFTLVVAKPYASALGREYAPKANPSPIFVFGPLVCTFITTVTSAMLIEALNISTYHDALIFGTVIGLGYQVTVMTNVAINPNIQHPFRYSAINAPYFLLASIAVSMIVVAMR